MPGILYLFNFFSISLNLLSILVCKSSSLQNDSVFITSKLLHAYSALPLNSDRVLSNFSISSFSLVKCTKLSLEISDLQFSHSLLDGVVQGVEDATFFMFLVIMVIVECVLVTDSE